MMEMSPSYQDRLLTFTQGWLSDFPPNRLAQAGFMFMGFEDCIICPFCYVEGFRWVEGDDPLTDHIKWSPRCSFIQSFFPQIKTKENNIKFKDKVTLESRLVTFVDWPVAIKQKPEELAAAVFFYTGCIQCFHCGIVLKDLLPHDEIYQRYSAVKKNCEFLENSTNDICKECLRKKEEVPKEDYLCKVCMSKEISILMLPCRHIVTCKDCIVNLEKCCVCRTNISLYLPVFL